MNRWRMFMLFVLVLFGAIAAVSGLTAVVLFAQALWAAGVVATVFAVVMAVMATSVKRSYDSLS